jgi:hypothetical protein
MGESGWWKRVAQRHMKRPSRQAQSKLSGACEKMGIGRKKTRELTHGGSNGQKVERGGERGREGGREGGERGRGVEEEREWSHWPSEPGQRDRKA